MRTVVSRIVAEVTNKFLLYCDLDDVLVDFKGACEKLGVYEKLSTDPETAWKKINAKGAAFWEKMEWMPGAQVLWKFIAPYDPIILSARSEDRKSVTGKRQWIKKQLGRKDGLIVWKKDKKDYASPKSVLIDDDENNIIEWENAGGVGVHHKTVDATIQTLSIIMGLTK